MMSSDIDSDIDDALAQSAMRAVSTYPNIHFIGIRHHSPRCATVVKQWIDEQRPDVVLIEAPNDIRPMLSQLLLPHTLPIALFSYRQERRVERLDSERADDNDASVRVTPDFDCHSDVQTAQSWFPLLSFSPEWVAIQRAHALGAAIDFIDLPHWSYRAHKSGQRESVKVADGPRHTGRYHQVTSQLLDITGSDNQDALWERWFESAPNDIAAKRLSRYFSLLRADDIGSDEDQCREGYMASWINHYQATQPSAKILVVCGGWHVNGIQRLLATPSQQSDHSPPDLDHYLAEYFHTQAPDTDGHSSGTLTTQIVAQGNYLVPIDFTRVERLIGYAAGMPSPQYYQWLFEADMEASTAFEQAMIAITKAIRAARQPLSTADLIVWSQSSHQLATLRGLDSPYRQELLDGMLNGIINEALSLPPPWSSSKLNDSEAHIELYGDDDKTGYHSDVQIRPLYAQDHPLLKLALATLTGSQRGVLARSNPAPPLLKYIEQYLASLDIMPAVAPRTLTLSYRDDSERLCLYALWQLSVLRVSGLSLLASKSSLATLNPQLQNHASPRLAIASEQWQLQQNDQWEVEIIEASRFGTTLHEASKAALMEQLTCAKYLVDASEQIAAVSHVLTQAIQCGFSDIFEVLTTQLRHLLWHIKDRSAISQLGKTFIHLMQRGFYDHDIEALLAEPFILLIERLLWLLEGAETLRASNEQAAKQADIVSIEVIKFAIEHAAAIHAAALRANDIDGNAIKKNPTLDSKASAIEATSGTLDVITMMTRLHRLTNACQSQPHQPSAHASQTLHGACVAAYFSLSNQAGLSEYFIVQRRLNTPYVAAIPLENNRIKPLKQRHWQPIPEQLPIIDYITLIRAIPIMVLGDFLLGLFAIGRHDVMQGQQTALLRCLHHVIGESSDALFLQSLPSLRQAFCWFPPKERYQISKNVALIMGLDTAQTADWQRLLRQQLPDTADRVAQTMTQAARLEQQTAACLHNLIHINE